MQFHPHDDTFTLYAISCLILVANLIFLWMASAVARARAKAVKNPEDVKPGTVCVEIDPPSVARILRAHENALANIMPFLLLGLVYTLAGGTAWTAQITFGVFIIARLLHSYCYLNAKQPWRSGFFLIGMLSTVALIIEILCLMTA